MTLREARLREELITRLLALPGEIEAAEQALHAASCEVHACRAALLWAEADVLLDSEKIDGKNEAQRKAQLYRATEPYRIAFDAAEKAHAAAVIPLHTRQNELRALCALARLVGGKDGDA